MAEYGDVQRGSLKLKGVAGGSIKKKKKSKSKDRKKMLEQISNATDSGSEDNRQTKLNVDKRTKAEITFDKIKEKRTAEQLMEKASMTHKERILQFNEHLDSISEHYDIPKVSWTK